MKMFYSIGEAAEILDIPTSTIRFWEKSFDILRPHKTTTGQRKFTNADIDNLKRIYHLVREKGMTLDGARKRLRENAAGVSRDQEVMDRLLRIRTLLQEIREELGEDEGVVYRVDNSSPDEWVAEEMLASEALEDAGQATDEDIPESVWKEVCGDEEAVVAFVEETVDEIAADGTVEETWEELAEEVAEAEVREEFADEGPLSHDGVAGIAVMEEELTEVLSVSEEPAPENAADPATPEDPGPRIVEQTLF